MLEFKMENMIDNVKGTMAIENQFLNNEDINLMKSFLNNEISMDQAIDMIKLSTLE